MSPEWESVQAAEAGAMSLRSPAPRPHCPTPAILGVSLWRSAPTPQRQALTHVAGSNGARGGCRARIATVRRDLSRDRAAQRGRAQEGLRVPPPRARAGRSRESSLPSSRTCSLRTASGRSAFVDTMQPNAQWSERASACLPWSCSGTHGTGPCRRCCLGMSAATPVSSRRSHRRQRLPPVAASQARSRAV